MTCRQWSLTVVSHWCVHRQWEEAEMLVLLQVMFTDLDFLTALHIELDVLQNFLFEVYCHYNSIPFHNFRHCFCVTQMVRTRGRGVVI